MFLELKLFLKEFYFEPQSNVMTVQKGLLESDF